METDLKNKQTKKKPSEHRQDQKLNKLENKNTEVIICKLWYPSNFKFKNAFEVSSWKKRSRGQNPCPFFPIPIIFLLCSGSSHQLICFSVDVLHRSNKIHSSYLYQPLWLAQVAVINSQFFFFLSLFFFCVCITGITSVVPYQVMGHFLANGAWTFYH